MCAISEFQFNGKEWSVYLGYFGGSITVDGQQFKFASDSTGLEGVLLSAYLNTLSKTDLVQLIIKTLENGEEA